MSRSEQALRDDQGGFALVGVIAAAVFVFLTLATLSMTTMTSTRSASMERGAVSALAAADSGIDAALGAAISETCDPDGSSDEFGYSFEIHGGGIALQTPEAVGDYGVYAGCPKDGDRYMIIRAVGEGVTGQSLTVTHVYRWGDGSDEQLYSSGEPTQMPTLISRVEER